MKFEVLFLRAKIGRIQMGKPACRRIIGGRGTKSKYVISNFSSRNKFRVCCIIKSTNIVGPLFSDKNINKHFQKSMLDFLFPIGW